MADNNYKKVSKSDDDDVSELTAALAKEEAMDEDVPASVEVVAPSDLPGGFALKCMLSGREFFVTVPPLGVKEGDLFVGDVKQNAFNSPYGQWRDGACDCFKYGLFHSMCWLSTGCLLMVLGQVQTRESLNCCGRKGRPPSSSSTFNYMILMSIIFFLGHILYLFLARPYWRNVEDHAEGSRLAVYISYYVYILLWVLFTLFAIVSTRRNIRNKYRIPGNLCEDFWCAIFCNFCTVCQMARHTYDYEKYPVQCFSHACCCSKTGVLDSAPQVV